MKSKASLVVDAAMVVVLCIVALSVISRLPKIWDELTSEIALSTSEIVAHDLAGIISISSAAPEDISISYYIPLEDINYTVELDQRKLTVEMSGYERLLTIEEKAKRFSVSYPVDGLQIRLEDQDKFKVIKRRSGLDNSYDFKAVK